MKNILNYFWPILLAVYIISPLDAHPLFIDDLLASVVLFYLLFRNAKKRGKGQSYHSSYNQSGKSTVNGSHEPQTLDEAYTILGVNRDTKMDEVRKAYREKVALSHPDKVSHLSRELQEKAEDLTLKLNRAYALITSRKK